jgi:hypothetical protein
MWWLINDDYCVHFNHKGLLRGETSAGQQQQQQQQESWQPQREAEHEVEVGYTLLSNNFTATEEQCFLRGPCWDVISRNS